MLRRLAALALLALAACNPDSLSRSAPESAPEHRFGMAPIGSPQTNYTGLAVVSASVKAGPATLLQAYVVNRNAAARYFQLFDQGDGGLPGSGAVPAYQYLVPAATAVNVPLLPGGQSMNNGIIFGVSTAAGSYTAATAADHDVEIVYQ